jgi:ankyrin repeat protein
MSFNSPELVQASQQGDMGAVRRLVESGADVNSVGDYGMVPLLSFTPSVVAYLLSMGADPNRCTMPGVPTLAFWRDVRTPRETPLHRAVAYASEETVQFLLLAGADKTIRDANGDSPQSWASWHWRPERLIDLLNPRDVT